MSTVHSLGRALLVIRDRCGLTQEQLAHLMCTTGQTISNWESGRAYPSGFNASVIIRWHEAVQVGSQTSLLEARLKDGLKKVVAVESESCRRLALLEFLFRCAP